MVEPIWSAALSVFTGFSFVPALLSSPAGLTKTPHESATVFAFSLGMHEGGGPPSLPPVPELELVLVEQPTSAVSQSAPSVKGQQPATRPRAPSPATPTSEAKRMAPCMVVLSQIERCLVTTFR
jgi:hypothetical protein